MIIGALLPSVDKQVKASQKAFNEKDQKTHRALVIASVVLAAFAIISMGMGAYLMAHQGINALVTFIPGAGLGALGAALAVGMVVNIYKTDKYRQTEQREHKQELQAEVPLETYLGAIAQDNVSQEALFHLKGEELAELVAYFQKKQGLDEKEQKWLVATLNVYVNRAATLSVISALFSKLSEENKKFVEQSVLRGAAVEADLWVEALIADPVISDALVDRFVEICMKSGKKGAEAIKRSMSQKRVLDSMLKNQEAKKQFTDDLLALLRDPATDLKGINSADLMSELLDLAIEKKALEGTKGALLAISTQALNPGFKLSERQLLFIEKVLEKAELMQDAEVKERFKSLLKHLSVDQIKKYLTYLTVPERVELEMTRKLLDSLTLEDKIAVVEDVKKRSSREHAEILIKEPGIPDSLVSDLLGVLSVERVQHLLSAMSAEQALSDYDLLIINAVFRNSEVLGKVQAEVKKLLGGLFDKQLLSSEMVKKYVSRLSIEEKNGLINKLFKKQMNQKVTGPARSDSNPLDIRGSQEGVPGEPAEVERPSQEDLKILSYEEKWMAFLMKDDTTDSDQLEVWLTCFTEVGLQRYLEIIAAQQTHTRRDKEIFKTICSFNPNLLTQIKEDSVMRQYFSLLTDEGKNVFLERLDAGVAAKTLSDGDKMLMRIVVDDPLADSYKVRFTAYLMGARMEYAVQSAGEGIRTAIEEFRQTDIRGTVDRLRNSGTERLRSLFKNKN